MARTLSKRKAEIQLPVAWPNQDSKLGLIGERSGDRNVTAYAPDLALQICELIAEGHTLKSICEQTDKFPHRSTFQRWVINYPELRKAYLAARELSAFAFEDQALTLAREIVNEPGNAQRVRAFDIAMNQLRWSATKRNPREFGDKSSLQITVPIQINTGLDLGDGSGAASGNAKTIDGSAENIYKVQGQVPAPVSELMEPDLYDNGSLVKRGRRPNIKAKGAIQRTPE